MLNLLKVLPLAVLISACASTFGTQGKNALSYQEAAQLTTQDAIGKTVVLGGPIINYNYAQNSTQIEIINAPLDQQSAPSNKGNMNERAIIVIPEKIPTAELNNVRISAIGTITEIAEMKRYGNSTVIMITADQYRIWRTAKPMYGPDSKPRYGYTYTFE